MNTPLIGNITIGELIRMLAATWTWVQWLVEVGFVLDGSK